MILRQLLRDRKGASAAEFALVLPFLLLLLFGIIDGGRFVWEYNRAEKATQMGARMAVVIDPVAGGVWSASLVGVNCAGNSLVAGNTLSACPGVVPAMTCNSSTCACSGCPTGLPGTYNSTAFTNIVNRMKEFDPEISPANVEVVYQGSGLGYVGDPNGPAFTPLVTVRLKQLQFAPITSLVLATISMPSFSTTLTGEDLIGNVSN